ncbi:6-bladed beta-propeller [Parabacteroides sp. OttesenSCG-928-G07]|nr:6-bladed beta-propeller [Parabacteroides sp. OttesenSCG-928-G21]MDL2278131.1 6-bladed beta-propeller [Parabacteroides sp. OttesenSCG-928-G07]
MKRVNSLLMVPFLLTMVSESIGQKQAIDNGFITVDVTKSYSPKKELILQNFMDVEYIVLETNDEFVNQGFVLDIGKDLILVKNRVDDGDIFIYDRQGKALRKINRQGQGSEEYIYITNAILDEENKEIFVNDHITKNIFVYDLYGKFKRSFKHKKDPKAYGYLDIFNYNQDNLICYDKYNEEISFVLISKKDGGITQEIKIPFKEKKLLMQTNQTSNGTYVVGPGPYRSIIPFKGNWYLLEPSSDAIYQFFSDYSLRPFIVRTPSVSSMEPEIFLSVRLFSDRYYFMETIKNEYDWKEKTGFPKTFFMYDNHEEAFFRYAVYNGDFSAKKEIYMNAASPVNHEIESWYPLEAHQLIESYEKGELKGKLKEIAAQLDEEDNRVIMLVKHKK